MGEAEEWRAVPGWSAYEVSSLGRVRRIVRATGFGGGGFRGVRKPYPGEYGHLWLMLRQDGRRARFPVHRLVLLAFVGPQPSPRHQGAHNDGDPANNAPANLRWATQSENQMDRALHGTSNRGERQHMARLTREQVVDVRARLAKGEAQTDIAKMLGVHRCTILAIKRGQSWSWLQ